MAMRTEPRGAPAEGATAVVMETAGRTAVVHLGAVGTSVAAGTAVLRFVGDRLLEVRLEVAGLEPDSRYPADIHFGSCAGGGPAAYPLRDLVSDTSGTARSTTAVPDVPVIPPQGWYIQVYAGPVSDAGTAVPVACGDVALPDPVFAPAALLCTGPVSVVLSMQNGSAANGTATFAFSGPELLSATLALNSLLPHSVHPAHIHFGTCSGGGPIGYYLNDVVADAHGTAVSTTEIGGIHVIPAVGWAVNVHAGPTLSGAGATPIACGDVHPGAPVIPPPG